ncbi:MAG: 2Fe-2S iron-sulfur cluster binding domain-containing protein [Cryomorphaceae bacterium]|nr:2Fe-2S iron-sulfur cluster binding domain-containing protein [Cryomorphaceae bacterium]
MSKKIKIICDDVEYYLEMDDDKTILELALENDVDAPYSCQGGICSTCLAKLNKGSVKMDNNQILTDDEVEDGYILSCQARPTSDEVVINFDEV